MTNKSKAPDIDANKHNASTKNYDEATRKLVRIGRVETDAGATLPQHARETTPMKDAQRAVLLHATTPTKPVQEPLPAKPKVEDPPKAPPGPTPPIVKSKDD